MMHIDYFTILRRQGDGQFVPARLTGRLAQNLRRNLRGLNYGIMAVLVVALSGCLAPPLKPSADKLSALGKILVVPVETPPLEVVPDPVADGIPVSGQLLYDSMPLSAFVSEKIYRHPGGVLIAGLVDSDALVSAAEPQGTPAGTGPITGTQPLAAHTGSWMASMAISEAAVARLNARQAIATLSNGYRQLPLASEDRTAYLGNWDSAIRQWYKQEFAALDYRQLAAPDIDAVLEIGIRSYRVFYGQVSLQVLFKLIDPKTGLVIGRASARDYSVENSAATLLGGEADYFKSVIVRMGAGLMASGLNELGLAQNFRKHEIISGQTVADNLVR